MRDLRQDARLIDERILVAEQHIAVADRDHVVVEYALINDIRVLLSEDGARIGQPVAACDGLGCFQ